MRLAALAVAAILAVAPVTAQQAAPSTDPAARVSPAGDAARPDPAGDLPVSLDRIRDGLSRPPQGSALKNLDIKPDFIVRIEERDHIVAILSALEVKKGPTPPGGLYAYEQQQLLGNKIDRPLQQPYAAFSGKEMITLAIEGLMQRYLGSKLVDGITSAQRERAERAAREEVAEAITEYCDARPDGGSSLHLCTDVVSR